MRVAPAGPDRLADWARLRAELWPDEDAATHLAELRASDRAGFLALGDEEAVGFAEASVRRDYVNGLDASPAAYLEGLYVRRAHRRRGVARLLVAAVEDWARGQGLAELGSDAPLANRASRAAHRALGFAETERVAFFRRAL